MVKVMAALELLTFDVNIDTPFSAVTKNVYVQPDCSPSNIYQHFEMLHATSVYNA